MKIGILPLTFLIFLTLKLCDVIAWSWWWVTAPLWGPFALAAAIFSVFGCVGCVVAAIDKKLT